MNVIIDSNVIIAALSTRGLCKAVFELCLDRYNIIISNHILAEISSTLTLKFKIPKKVVKSILSFLKEYCILCNETDDSINLCRDKDDNKILALCRNNEIKYIITGDNDLLVLKEFEKTLMITPRELWEIVREQKL